VRTFPWARKVAKVIDDDLWGCWTTAQERAAFRLALNPLRGRSFPLARLAVIVGVAANTRGRNPNTRATEMRGLLVASLIVLALWIVGTSLGLIQNHDTPLSPASNPKTDNETQTDADKAALIKVIKDAVAARHGGVVPKTMSEDDINISAQAAMNWKAKQAAQKAKRELDAMKVKPPPSSGYGEIAFAKEAITKIMRDPDSAVFGDVFFVNDRKTATGYYVPVVCGTVNGRNGFGGMTGQKHFVAVTSDVGSGVWMEGTTPQNVFAPEWNRYCAGQHN
jgi:hypothetical protein